MSLTNLAQIKGGLALQTDVNALKTSYDAAKVLTTVVKTAAEGETPAVNYNANELLSQLKTTLDSIAGNGSDSLAALRASITALSEKHVKDTVRVLGTATYNDGDYSLSFDGNIDTLAPGTDKTTELKVYTRDNKAVYDTAGNQLTYDFATNEFSGTPAMLDLATSKTNSASSTAVKDNTLNFTALNQSFEFKVFPVGTFELGSIPEAALLDNEEVDLLAYDAIINKIIVELAKDDDVVAGIINKVGEQTVADQITAITDVLAGRVTALENGKIDKTSIASTINPSSVPEGTEGTAASATKVASELAVATAIEALEDEIAALESDSSDTYVAKSSVIRTDATGEGAKTAIATTVDAASDDLVISEKTLVTKVVAMEAATQAAASAAAAANTNANGRVSKTEDLVTTVREATNVSDSTDVASDTKVATEKAVRTAIDDAVTDVNSSLTNYVPKSDIITALTDDNKTSTSNVASAAALQTAINTRISTGAIVTSIGAASTYANDTTVASAKAIATALEAQEAADTTARATLQSTINQQSERISALEAIAYPVNDKITVSSATAVTSFTLTSVPSSSQLVEMYINGLVYFESDAFTVDRTNRIVTWTYTAANGGFDITNELTDAVRFKYTTGNTVANTTTVTILHQDSIPTTGTFKVGDLVYKLTMVQGENIGWVCSTAGTPGAWTEFGVVNFGETIQVVEDEETT